MAAVQRALGGKHMAWVFLGPNILFFGLFVFLPIGINIVLSVTGGTNLFLSDRPFVGGPLPASARLRLLSEPRLLPGGSFLERRGEHAEIHGFPDDRDGRQRARDGTRAEPEDPRRGFFRAVYFFPVLLSPVVVALIWKWILQRDGLLNAAITGAGGQKILFFVDPSWAMFWAVFVSVWAHMGFYTLILLAGLQAIPADLYEAAEMDGTPPMRVLTRITLPLLWPNLLVVLVLVLIKAVQTFDEVFVLTGGGPGTATVMIVQYIYETAFANQVQNFGLAAAASMLLGGLLFALTMAQLWLARRKSA